MQCNGYRQFSFDSNLRPVISSKTTAAPIFNGDKGPSSLQSTFDKNNETDKHIQAASFRVLEVNKSNNSPRPIKITTPKQAVEGLQTPSKRSPDLKGIPSPLASPSKQLEKSCSNPEASALSTPPRRIPSCKSTPLRHQTIADLNSEVVDLEKMNQEMIAIFYFYEEISQALQGDSQVLKMEGFSQLFQELRHSWAGTWFSYNSKDSQSIDSNDRNEVRTGVGCLLIRYLEMLECCDQKEDSKDLTFLGKLIQDPFIWDLFFLYKDKESSSNAKKAILAQQAIFCYASQERDNGYVDHAQKVLLNFIQKISQISDKSYRLLRTTYEFAGQEDDFFSFLDQESIASRKVFELFVCRVNLAFRRFSTSKEKSFAELDRIVSLEPRKMVKQDVSWILDFFKARLFYVKKDFVGFNKMLVEIASKSAENNLMKFIENIELLAVAIKDSTFLLDFFRNYCLENPNKVYKSCRKYPKDWELPLHTRLFLYQELEGEPTESLISLYEDCIQDLFEEGKIPSLLFRQYLGFLARRGLVQKAREQLEKHIKRYPEDIKLQLFYIKLNMTPEHEKIAMEQIQNILEKESFNGLLWLALASLQLNPFSCFFDLSKAEESLHKAQLYSSQFIEGYAQNYRLLLMKSAPQSELMILKRKMELAFLEEQPDFWNVFSQGEDASLLSRFEAAIERIEESCKCFSMGQSRVALIEGIMPHLNKDQLYSFFNGSLGLSWVNIGSELASMTKVERIAAVLMN